MYVVNAIQGKNINAKHEVNSAYSTTFKGYTPIILRYFYSIFADVVVVTCTHTQERCKAYPTCGVIKPYIIPITGTAYTIRIGLVLSTLCNPTTTACNNL